MKKSILFISLYLILQACSTAPDDTNSTTDTTTDQSLEAMTGITSGLNEAESKIPIPVPSTMWDSTTTNSDGSLTVNKMYITSDGNFVQYGVTASGSTYDDLSYIQGTYSKIDRDITTVYDKEGGNIPSGEYTTAYVFRELESMDDSNDDTVNKIYYLTKTQGTTWDLVAITISSDSAYLPEGKTVADFPQNTFTLTKE